MCYISNPEYDKLKQFQKEKWVTYNPPYTQS